MHFRRDDKISIDLSKIKITGVACLQLIDIDIVENFHQHGICRLVLRVDKKLDSKTILGWNQTQITVKADKDIIFCGIISQCRLDARIDANYLHVTAQTLSIKLDSARKFETFQDAKKKFSTILSTIEKNYKPAEISCWKDNTVAEIICRENLNDWEFLKELAESHGQILFADSKSDKLRVSVGFKAFKEFDADPTMKLLRRVVPMDLYKRLEANTYSGARSAYFAETDLLTDKITIGAGHAVKYDNQSQAVMSSHIYVRDNILYNEIRLRHAEGVRADARDVMKHFDKFYYLTGKVLESKDTNVKVHFDWDQKQDKNSALDIPYESPVSNYLYTMPDVDDKVFVYVDHIRQAAMGSLRSKAVSDEYQKRSFKVAKNSALIIEKDKMEFNAAEKTLLEEGDGIKFSTPKNIIFSSKGDIIIKSAKGTEGSSGKKADTVELSDLAKELDKITGRKDKKSDNKKSGGGMGGTIKLDAKKSALVKVKDSAIEMKGSNLNVKTSKLVQNATIPMPGGGLGTLTKFSGGSPKARSEKVNVEKGKEDRARNKENPAKTPDDKNISR